MPRFWRIVLSHEVPSVVALPLAAGKLASVVAGETIVAEPAPALDGGTLVAAVVVPLPLEALPTAALPELLDALPEDPPPPPPHAASNTSVERDTASSLKLENRMGYLLTDFW